MGSPPITKNAPADFDEADTRCRTARLAAPRRIVVESEQENPMARAEKYVPHGVIPAALTVFHDDFSIDWKATVQHFRFMAEVTGVTALTLNGHAAEVHALTLEEQQRLLEAGAAAVGGRVALVAGVFADGSHQAARIAKMSAKAGASALLVFPPQVLMFGGYLRPEMALAHYQAIADATDLPLILFQYTMASGLGYPFETILRLIEQIPTIRAMKDWCNDPMMHEKHTRALQSLPRPVNMLTTHSSWLMASLVMGANGLLSGAGSVIADMQVALFDAVRGNDLALARRVNESMFPVVQAFYAPPFLDMHNRMKECLALLGRIPRAVVRPPLMKLPAPEIAALRRALRAAGVEKNGWQGIAASKA
jgi:4-hydroxy-tetrahydrodipicolinate synthase